GPPPSARLRRRSRAHLGRGPAQLGGDQGGGAGAGGARGGLDDGQRVRAPARGDGGLPDDDQGVASRLRLAGRGGRPGQAGGGGRRAQGSDRVGLRARGGGASGGGGRRPALRRRQ